MRCYGHLINKCKGCVLGVIIRSIIWVIAILLATNTLLFINANSAPARVREKAARGEPYCFIEDKQYWSGISDFTVCKNYLYVMYDGKTVLMCYDTEGRYLRSYSFKMSKNGKSHLYVVDGRVYLEVRGHDIYSFENGCVSEYIPSQSMENETLRNTRLEDAAVTNHGSYKLQGASICYINGGEEIAVVARPIWMVIFQGATQIVCSLACIFALILLIRVYLSKMP